MVRTAAAGIKVSSGKSGKKGGNSGGSSSTKNGGSSSSNRLPSIPHTETPSWQKPITNFFYNKKDSIKINDDQTDSLEKESMENKGEKSVQDDKTLTYEKINQSQTENTSTE